MPRYLALFKYSEAGAKGLMKEKAAAREAAGKRAYESVGGTSEALYWIPNGEYHGVEIIALQAPRQPGQFRRLPIPLELSRNTARSNCSRRANSMQPWRNPSRIVHLAADFEPRSKSESKSTVERRRSTPSLIVQTGW